MSVYIYGIYYSYTESPPKQELMLMSIIAADYSIQQKTGERIQVVQRRI